MYRFLSSEKDQSTKIDTTCIICFEGNDGDLTFTTNKCDHHACQGCLAQYLKTYLESSSSIMRDYETIPCPQYKCNQEYSSGTIVDLAMPTHEEAATWWRKMIEKTSTENLGTCPYDGCEAVFELLPEQSGELTTFTECLECHRGLCIQCGNKWHEGGCKDKRWARVTLPKNKRDDTIRRKNSMELRRVAKQKGWSRCPKCHHMVERTAGCSHILCKCGTDFCYQCGSILSKMGNRVANAGCLYCRNMSSTALQEHKDKHIYQYETEKANV